MVLENIPAEVGEETVIDYNDDATITSKIFFSESGKKAALSGDTDTTSSMANDGNEERDAKEEDENHPTTANRREAETSAASEKVPLTVDVVEAKVPDEKPCAGEEENATETENDELTVDEERDFDKDPTILYAMVQKKLWKEAVERAKGYPEEASIWVSRREKDGRLRWRLLPLHAAIVFKAPEDLVEALLTAFSKGSEAKDDQGMLPLHLAFRNGASEAVVNLLLVAYPASVDIPDRKGRVPQVLAQAAPSPNREVFMKALEKGPGHYAIAAVAAARANIVKEQEAIFEAKLAQVREQHEMEIAAACADSEKEKQLVQEKVTELEEELTKTQETSQVLVDHVNSLEAQLNSRTDTERFLATKIANLDQKLKEMTALKEELETNMYNERSLMSVEKDGLSSNVKGLEEQLANIQEKLAKSVEQYEKRHAEWTTTEAELREKLHETEVDWANAQANGAIVEAQLKKRMENEHLLASQVSTLASRLAESANDSKDNTRKYTQIIHEMEEERFALKEKNEDLVGRLKFVAKVIEDMSAQQVQIVDDAIAHEEMIAKALETHAKIVTDAVDQEKELEKAKDEREVMKQMLIKQENAVLLANEKRNEIMHSVALQGKYMSSTKGARETMLSNISTMGDSMNDALKTVMDGLKMMQQHKAAVAEDNKKAEELGKVESQTDENTKIPELYVDDEDRITASRE